MEPEAKLPVNAWRHRLSTVMRGFPMLISALVTFLVVILILYLINLLPIDGRAKQIARVVVIILGVISLLKYIAVF
jgi:Na+/melibiose symporter-like transporter